MNTTYLQNKREIAQKVWEWMEEMQEYHPHLEFGWNGFIPMVILRLR